MAWLYPHVNIWYDPGPEDVDHSREYLGNYRDYNICYELRTWSVDCWEGAYREQ